MSAQRQPRGSTPRRHYRFEPNVCELLKRLRSKLGGVSETDVLRIALKRLAAAEGVE